MGLGRRDRLKCRLRVIFFFKGCLSIKRFNIYLSGSGDRQGQDMKQQIFIECRCRRLLTIQRSGEVVVHETKAQSEAESWLHCPHEPSNSSPCILVFSQLCQAIPSKRNLSQDTHRSVNGQEQGLWGSKHRRNSSLQRAIVLFQHNVSSQGAQVRVRGVGVGSSGTA